MCYKKYDNVHACAFVCIIEIKIVANLVNDNGLYCDYCHF